MALTVESLVLEFGRALAPLEQRLRGGEVRLLFAELGLPAPDRVLGDQAVTAALSTAADQLTGLPAALSVLAEAIEAGDSIRIAEAVARAAPIVQATSAAIGAVAARIGSITNSGGPARDELEAFAAELAERLFGYLVATYLDRHRPVVGHLFTLFGIIESSAQAATPAAPAHVRRRLRLDRFASLVEDPVDVAAQVYGWGTAAFDWDLLLTRLAIFLGRVSNFAFVQPGPPPVLRIALIDVGPTDDRVPGVQAVLRVAASEGLDAVVPVGDTVALTAQSDAAIEVGAVVALLPPAELRVVAPTQVSGTLRLGVQAPPATGTPPIVVLGTAGGSRVQAEKVRITLGADLTWDPVAGRADGALMLEASVEGGKVVLSLAGADGLLSAILPDGPIELDVDLLLRWSSATGLHFDGTAGLEIDVPVDFSAPSAKISDLHVALAVVGQGFKLELSCSIAAQLGPFDLVVEQTGTNVLLSLPSGGGNLGLADLSVGFKTPNGVGVTFDAGPATGGGFLYFNPDRNEYAGALELQLGKVGIKAIGVLSTGPDDWSLLLLLYAQIPPIQLAFGFTLEGIGGLIGVQRGVDTRALITGMKTRAFDDILFPADPVGDAPQILNRLRTLFPARPGSLVIGPMVDLRWGKPQIIVARLAVLVQLDNALEVGGGPVALTRVVVIGQLRVAIGPTEDDPDVTVVLLIVDVVGFWELASRRYGFLAALRDSYIAGIDITGGLGVWGEYGDHPRFLLAAGGFNPRFQDVPAEMSGALDRLGASFSVGRFSLVLTGYFAFTPATIQAGLNLLASAKIGPVGIKGDIGFDVLVYLRPRTHFIADFHVIAEVTYRGHTLAGVKVTGTIEGPGRWHLKGKLTFSILWWDISKSFDESWGGLAALAGGVIDVLALLTAELVKPENWSAQLPAGSEAMVTLAPHHGDSTPKAHPLGRFVFSQRVTPLGLGLEKYGENAISGPNRFDIISVTIGGQPIGQALPAARRTPVREHFARAQFFEMTDEDKLTRPSFEQMDAGVEFSSTAYEISSNPPVTTTMDYETAYLDLHTQQTRTDTTLNTVALDYDLIEALGRHGAAGRAAQRAHEHMRTKNRLRITVSAPPLAAADRTTLTAVPTAGQPTSTQMIAEQRLRTADAARSQIVEAFELAQAQQ
ncbi:MAG: hypothetical protein M3460_16690 [Actinomycetota bacterium]|nr:hypothetical protein [Actinomycetota bacterium]